MNSLEYIHSFLNFEKDLRSMSYQAIKLDRIKAVLKELNDPQCDFPVIHIVGSKGKGSTCAIVSQILKEQGYKVGLFTSPHIISVHERIRVLNGSIQPKSSDILFKDQIDEKSLTRLVDQLKPMLEKYRQTDAFGTLTYFEVLMIIAWVYFKESQVDFVVLEAGLGGRYDATNVGPSKVCAITTIDLEHTDILGQTLSAIAQEKAAVIKDVSQKVVLADQQQEVIDVVMQRCKEFGVEAVLADKIFRVRENKRTFDFQSVDVEGQDGLKRTLKMPLIGKHQLKNIPTVLAIVQYLRELNVVVTDASVEQGFQNVCWPCRMEYINTPIKAVLDGAHTVLAIRGLINTVKELWPQQKINLVFGINNDKSDTQIFRELKGFANRIIFTKSFHPRAKDIKESHVESFFDDEEIIYTQSVGEALEVLLKEPYTEDLNIFTGSLFVASEARYLLKEKQNVSV